MKAETFLSVLRAMERADTFEALSQAFQPVQDHFGLATFLCARITAASGAPREETRSTAKDVRSENGIVVSRRAGAALMAATVDPDWMKRYANENHVENDPVLWQSLFRAEPFLWNLSFRHPALPERYQERVLSDAADCGIRGGLIWPIHEPGMTVGIVSCFAQGDAGRLRDTLRDDGEALLNCLIRVLYKRCVALSGYDQPRGAEVPLTKREKEVLHWAALGKTAWETSRILEIAERTVNFHLANAMRKLHADSRLEAASIFATREWGGLHDTPAPEKRRAHG